jgi:GMP synthase (glutamine-hydrolysing)
MGEWLRGAGLELDVRRPYAGETLPGSLEEHSGLMIMGGAMNAYADEACPWLPPTRALVRRAAADGVPTLGICLGHQLVTVALGGRVHQNPAGRQIGVLDVGWLPGAADDALFGQLDGSTVAVQWNDDVVQRLPSGAVTIARGPGGEVQAARFAPTVWGVQWHPEAGGDIVTKWAENDRDRAAVLGLDVDAYVQQVRDATDRLRAAWRPLATRFAGLALRRTGSRA